MMIYLTTVIPSALILNYSFYVVHCHKENAPLKCVTSVVLPSYLQKIVCPPSSTLYGVVRLSQIDLRPRRRKLVHSNIAVEYRRYTGPTHLSEDTVRLSYLSDVISYIYYTNKLCYRRTSYMVVEMLN